MLMMLGSWWWSGQGGFPADAHDAGFVAVLMMLGFWRGSENGFPADALDAGSVAVEWKRFPADGYDAGFVAVEWKKGYQLMLMMLGSWR